MRTVGLEPTHLAVLEPKSSASTNFARLARGPGYHARVRIDTLKCLLSRASALLLVTACERATPTPGAAADAPVPAPTAQTTPGAAPAEAALAQVRDDVPLPLTGLLGHTVEEVQAQLGEHQGKGMVRKTCFRFAPARTHFTCRYAQQSYADKTGNFRSLRVAYEDGVAAAVAYDGWVHGSGEFTPEALLAAIGLTMPGPGKLQEPAPGVRLWTWFNSQARLLIDGKQHRVEVSIIDNDWSRSRVEVTMNHPLTPEQEALIVPVAGKGPIAPPDGAAPADGSAPANGGG